MRTISFLFILATLSQLTAQTEIRIQGMEPDKAEDALNRMSGRLTYVRSRPAAASRADDAAFLLNRHLELEGYKSVDVDWRLPADGSILLIVDKGQRYVLGDITIFDGDPPAPEEHKDYFLQPFIGREKLVQTEYPYLPEDVTEGGENLSNFLRSQGYWDATVDIAEPQFRSTTGTVDILIREKKGPLYTLARPVLNVSGAPIPESLPPRLTDLLGKPATAENINAMRKRVDDSFTKLGYPYLTLAMLQENRKNGTTQLVFNITTGNRFRVGDVEVEGAELTRNARITNRFSDIQGKEFEREEADKVVRKLLGTGAFTGITLDEVPHTTGKVDFLLRVKEAKPYGASVYAGAGSLEGFILGAGFYNRNVFGELYSLNVGLELSGLGLLGDISLKDPFFLEQNDLAATIRAFLLTRKFDTYDKLQGGASVNFEWQVNDYYTIDLGFEASFNELTAVGGLNPAELGIDKYLVGELSLDQTYDRRNDPAAPTEGYILGLETGFGLAIGDDSISYLRNSFTGSYYKKLTDKDHLAFGTRIGSIIPLGEQESLPIDLRFFNGGANSVRSFTERDLGPRSNGDNPRGGQSYFIANAEYIRTLTSIVKGVIFFDAGGLSRDSADFGLGDPRYTVGAGIRLDLPIGPVRLEYGRSLNPGQGEDGGAFHFAIGAAF